MCARFTLRTCVRSSCMRSSAHETSRLVLHVYVTCRVTCTRGYVSNRHQLSYTLPVRRACSGKISGCDRELLTSRPLRSFSASESETKNIRDMKDTHLADIGNVFAHDNILTPGESLEKTRQNAFPQTVSILRDVSHLNLNKSIFISHPLSVSIVLLFLKSF